MLNGLASLSLRDWFGRNPTGILLLRLASGTFIVSVLGTGLAFISNLLLARWMGVAEYGIYVYAVSWINALALPVTMGRNRIQVRFIPTYLTQDNFGLLRGLVSQSFQRVTIAGVLAGSAMALAVILLRDRMQPELYHSLIIGAFMLPILGLTALRSGALRGLKRVVRAALPEAVIRPAGLLVFVSLFFLFGIENLTASQVMLASLMSAVTAFSIGAVWLASAMPTRTRTEPPRYETRLWTSVALPLLVNTLLIYALNKADVLLLGLLSSTDAVGLYAVAARMSGLALFGVTAVGSILAPMIAERHARGDASGLQQTVTQGAWIAAATNVAILGGLVLLGPWLLSLFGEAFSAGYLPMLVLLAGHLVNALCGNVGFLMTMTGHHNATLRILGTAVVLHVLLSLALIPYWGAIGAAIATAFCEALWSISMVVYVRRNLHIDATIFASWRRKPAH